MFCREWAGVYTGGDSRFFNIYGGVFNIDLSLLSKHITVLKKANNLQQITKGFSSDGKYYVYDSYEKPIYVLRTSPIKQSERKNQEYKIIDQVYRNGILTSEPIDFGTIESLELCYMVLRYVDGQDASEMLPNLTSNEQYEIGIKAGEQLRFIHEIEPPVRVEDWYIHRAAKYKRQFNKYKNCGVIIPETNKIVSFIDDNLNRMLNRPDRLQHDDFHTGNLLIHQRSYSGCIDFNRFDWGDPFHDFLKIAYFSRDISIPFSIGQIEGYFEGVIPEDFWNLYALYTALTIFPTITWTLEVVPDNLENMLARIHMVLEDHLNFESVVPIWYKP